MKVDMSPEAISRRLSQVGELVEACRALRIKPGSVRPVDALLANAEARNIYWYVPDENSAAVEQARERGFTSKRTLTRKFPGENSTPGDPL